MSKDSFRKVRCIDTRDPDKFMRRETSLLVRTHHNPHRRDTQGREILGWQPEPALVTPIRTIDHISHETWIRKIYVIDEIFGRKTVKCITDETPECPEDASHDRVEIEALWPKCTRVPSYKRGQSRANLHYTPGEVKLDGARSDFETSYAAKYPIYDDAEPIEADDIPRYCVCNLKGDDESGRRMIQCSNEARYCLKEWYHFKCIGMGKRDVPPAEVEWFCDECVEGRLGKLAGRDDYTPWAAAPLRPAVAGEGELKDMHMLYRKRTGSFKNCD